MKKWIAGLAAVVVSFAGAFASAEEVKSGLDAGAAIPAEQLEQYKRDRAV